MRPVILGFDPSLSHFGCVVLGLEPLEVLDMTVVVTKPTAKKKRPRECDDQTRRARELALSLEDFLKDIDDDCQLVAVAIEAGALPRIGGHALFTPITASALGRARGILDGLFRAVPTFDFTPMEIRKEILGEMPVHHKKHKPLSMKNSTPAEEKACLKILKQEKERAREAKKQATRIAMEQLFPDIISKWPKDASNIEHAADALSVAIVCARSEFVKQVLQGIRNSRETKHENLRA